MGKLGHRYFTLIVQGYLVAKEPKEDLHHGSIVLDYLYLCKKKIGHSPQLWVEQGLTLTGALGPHIGPLALGGEA